MISSTMAECPAFAGLSTEQLDALFQIGAEIRHVFGDILVEMSEETRDLYLVLEGRVAVEVLSHSGHSQELATLRTGDLFGEMAFLQGNRRSARVRAIDDVRLLRFPSAQVRSLFDRDLKAGYRVMENIARMLSERLVTTNFRFRDAAN